MRRKEPGRLQRAAQLFALADWGSDSEFVDRAWSARSEPEPFFISVAASQWRLVVTTRHDRAQVTIRGPETRATITAIPDDAEFFGIAFSVGTFGPALPLDRLVDRTLTLPAATSARSGSTARGGRSRRPERRRVRRSPGRVGGDRARRRRRRLVAGRHRRGADPDPATPRRSGDRAHATHDQTDRPRRRRRRRARARPVAARGGHAARLCRPGPPHAVAATVRRSDTGSRRGQTAHGDGGCRIRSRHRAGRSVSCRHAQDPELDLHEPRRRDQPHGSVALRLHRRGARSARTRTGPRERRTAARTPHVRGLRHRLARTRRRARRTV